MTDSLTHSGYLQVGIIRALQKARRPLTRRELRVSVLKFTGECMTAGEQDDAIRILRDADFPVVSGINGRWSLGDRRHCTTEEAVVQRNRVLVNSHSYAVRVYRALRADHPEVAIGLLGMISAIEREITIKEGRRIGAPAVPLAPAVLRALEELN